MYWCISIKKPKYKGDMAHGTTTIKHRPERIYECNFMLLGFYGKWYFRWALGGKWYWMGSA